MFLHTDQAPTLCDIAHWFVKDRLLYEPMNLSCEVENGAAILHVGANRNHRVAVNRNSQKFTFIRFNTLKTVPEHVPNLNAREKKLHRERQRTSEQQRKHPRERWGIPPVHHCAVVISLRCITVVL